MNMTKSQDTYFVGVFSGDTLTCRHSLMHGSLLLNGASLFVFYLLLKKNIGKCNMYFNDINL